MLGGRSVCFGAGLDLFGVGIGSFAGGCGGSMDCSVLRLSATSGISCMVAAMACRVRNSWVIMESSAAILECSSGFQFSSSMAGGQDLALIGGDSVLLELVSLSVVATEPWPCMLASSASPMAASAMAMARLLIYGFVVVADNHHGSVVCTNVIMYWIMHLICFIHIYIYIIEMSRWSLSKPKP